MRPAAILVVACVAYLFAAWMVAPGFYDGFGPATPYAWTCPPPQAGANTKPTSGHVDIKYIGGVSDANAAYTNDGQLVIGFLPGAFSTNGKSSVSVDITPTATCPQPTGIKFVTNVYQITADATLVKDSNLTLVFSNLEPAPSAIYFATAPDGPWTSIGAQSEAQPYTIWQKTHQLGYFAAGYPAAARPPGSPTIGGGQTLPIIVAVLIAAVVVAGVPLAVLRRRRGGGEAEEDQDDA